jgi:hypothetical protein
MVRPPQVPAEFDWFHGFYKQVNQQRKSTQMKNLLSGNPSLGLVLLTLVVALAGAVQPAQAQPFRVGDYVDFQSGGTWTPCMVTKPLQNNGYGVSCGVTDYTTVADPQYIRSRVATADDQRIAAETATALARLPRPGNGPGAAYNTREPKTCATRSAPARGAPSAEQARQYFICDAEHVLAVNLSLVANVKVQVAPVVHPVAQVMILKASVSDIDPNQPVWDIRGSFTQYQCGRPASWDNAFARTHNCTVTEMSTAAGFCYKNTFGDWHCGMTDPAFTNVNTRQHVLPPESN